jgi:hypothetical protein
MQFHKLMVTAMVSTVTMPWLTELMQLPNLLATTR